MRTNKKLDASLKKPFRILYLNDKEVNTIYHKEI